PDQEFSASLGTTPRSAGSALDLGAYGFPRSADGGTPDGGAPADAGAPGGGGSGDGGDPAAPTGPGVVTGSCSTAPGGLSVVALAAVVVLLGRRRSVNSRS
ncbi:MAG TPA: MYXO-CTERM sorting domain-containing protein, partial [Myxococcaceae bacterium]